MLLLVGCNNNESKAVKIEENKISDLNNTEKEQLLEIIDELKYMDFYGKDILPRNLTNQEALRISYEILKSKGNYNELKFSDLEKIAIAYLGFGLEPENLLCDTHFVLSSGVNSDIYIYNNDTKKYDKNSSHVSHTDSGIKTDVYNSYVKGTKNGNEYVVSVNKIFSGILGSSYDAASTYYNSYKDSVSYKNVLFKGGKITDESFDKYRDKLVSYTYKFRYVDGNYVLSSYTIEK